MLADPSPSLGASLAGALVAGLLATPHCAAMCGGFAAACSAHRTRAGAAPWHAGRLAGYAALGAAAGAIGRGLPGPRWVPALVAVVLLAWSAASLAGLVGSGGASAALARPLVTATTALARRGGLWARLAFGAAVSLLPCGMVYAALGVSVASGGALEGAAVMLAFGAGTVPGLLVLGSVLRRVAGASLARRRLLAVGVLAAGLWVIGARWSASGDAPAAGHAHGTMHPHAGSH